MMHIKHLSAIGIGLIAFSSFAQNKKINLPIVEVLGKQYYVYEAKKNQTFFNIANDFHWDLEELMRINSKVLSPMVKGTKIYYPCSPESSSSYSSTEDGSPIPEEMIQPITHLVKKGETVYSISLMYDIPIEKLYSLNPGSRSGIKAGELLRIKDSSDATPIKGNPEFYTVKRGDTLYQLSKTFKTTVAAILNLNPGISEDNFKAGEIIKIPEIGEGIKKETKYVEEPTVLGFSSYKVDKKDTWDSVSEKTGVSVEELQKANGGTTNLKSNQIIGVPEIVVDSVYKTIVTEDPRELTLNGVSEIYDDVHRVISTSDSVKEIKIGILMVNPTSKIDLDFTRGFLTGMNQVKNTEYKVNLKVLDGRMSQEALIDSLGNYCPTMLFTTYEKNTPEFLADYALVSQVPVINTFDLKDETYLSNPYFVNILTPSNYFNEEIVNDVYNRFPGATLIVVGSETDSNDLLVALENKWDEKRIKRVADMEALADLSIVPSASYVIFGNVSKKDEISELAEKVAELRDENFRSTIGFLGRPNWIVYDEALKDSFQKADVMIPARFYYDKNSSEAKVFQSEYNKLFNMTPTKSFPMYSTMGYDEAIYFIPSLIKAGGDINEFRESTSSVQSDFDLVRTANWSGLINPMVYLVRFTPYGAIEKQKIK
ncbi:MAG: LysM peptidoglycan-binding domain-containing protein [Muribaculaceae bacterium]|nr:LysM peptidoglycan-binding domain-containing protein [Muribaculaceae bacterium]